MMICKGFSQLYLYYKLYVNQVTKLVRSSELSVSDRQLVFEAVGFKFLTRLLRTGNTFSLNNVHYWFLK